MTHGRRARLHTGADLFRAGRSSRTPATGKWLLPHRARLSRARLGRPQREVGDIEAARSAIEAADAWFRASGGGDEAAVAQCLLAAMDAEGGVPDAAGRLELIFEKAQAANDLEVQVLALDALAGLRAEAGDISESNEMLDRADALMAAAGHRLTEGDRLDGHRARALLDAAGVAPAS